MMEKKELTYNDGKGFYDSQGLCDTLLVDLNRIPKALMDGQNIQFCAIIQSMAQRLTKLKSGIKADLESKDKIIEELKRLNDELIQANNEAIRERSESHADSDVV